MFEFDFATKFFLSSILFSHLFCPVGKRSDHGGLPTDLGRTIRKTPRSEERPLTFSKAKGGLVPMVLEAEVEVEKQQEGVGQGEQGKLLLEVRIALINQPKLMQFNGCYAWYPNRLKWTG